MLPTIRRTWITDILLLCALFLPFYLAWLGSYPLFTPDEGRYSEAAREMLATGNFITPHVNGIPFLDKPILYYWLQSISIGLFGVKEWAIRLAPVLVGLLGCIMTYVCGRQLYDRKTGILSAVILATTPLYFGGAHYANLDLEVAVWISCTLLCIITAIQSNHHNRKRFMYAAYFFAALAFLTKGLIGLVFPVAITGLWIAIMRRWNLLPKLHLITGFALILIFTLPWYLAAQWANPDFLHYFFITQQFSRFISEGDYNNKAVLWFYLPVIAAGFFPWLIFLPQAFMQAYKKIRRAKKDYDTELFLLLWFAVVLVFFSIPHSKIVGYILPVFPALALLTGHYLAIQWDNTNKKIPYAEIAGFIVIAGIIAAALTILPHLQQSDMITHAKTLCVALANVLTAFAILALVSVRYLDIRKFFALCTAVSVISLLIIVGNANKLNINSAYPLIKQLKTIRHPDDRIFNYFKFYQDIPIYLEEKIYLVANWNSPDIADRDNWVREMWLGRNAPEAKDLLVDEKTFWEQWHSKKRVFVFLNTNYLSQFKLHVKHFYVLGTSNDIMLLSNQK